MKKCFVFTFIFALINFAPHIRAMQLDFTIFDPHNNIFSHPSHITWNASTILESQRQDFITSLSTPSSPDCHFLALRCPSWINDQDLVDIAQACPLVHYLDFTDCKKISAKGFLQSLPKFIRLVTLMLNGTNITTLNFHPNTQKTLMYFFANGCEQIQDFLPLIYCESLRTAELYKTNITNAILLHILLDTQVQQLDIVDCPNITTSTIETITKDYSENRSISFSPKYD
ncbi:MAG: hypothetical protein UU47_C0018G0014 [candidate division TM6 bacterium GW2011_GWE2_41_16]|nr:MAG: hypothetical protein UU47_C0018G0014 [candidate division TM6 bacterium GW2011_GWE2_41_16]